MTTWYADGASSDGRAWYADGYPIWYADGLLGEPETGGWSMLFAYEEFAEKRRKQERERRKREEEAEQITAPVDREIAELLHRQEAVDEKRGYLDRLGELAKQNADLDAARAYSDRVARALTRAIDQGNYSALEALDRELQRAQEEEGALTMVVLMLEDHW